MHGLRALDPAGRRDPLRRLELRRLPGTLRRIGAFLGVLEVAAHPHATFIFDARPRYWGRGVPLLAGAGDTFVTQQVGGRDLEELKHALGRPKHTYRSWNLAAATEELERVGFEVLDGREKLLPGAFYDIGAVALYLRIEIPDFNLAGYDTALRSLHAMMESGTPLKVNSHRFLISARSA